MFCPDTCGDFKIQLNCGQYFICNKNANNSTSNQTSCNSNNKSSDNSVCTNISFNTNDSMFHQIRFEDDTPPPNLLFDRHFLNDFSVVDGGDVWSDTVESVYSYNGTTNVKDLWSISYNISYKTYRDTTTPVSLGDNPVKLYVYIDGKKKFCRTYRNNRIKDEIILVVRPTNCIGFQLKCGQSLSKDINMIKIGKFSFFRFERFNINPRELTDITNPTS